MLWVVDPTPERATSFLGRRRRADGRSTADAGANRTGAITEMTPAVASGVVRTAESYGRRHLGDQLKPQMEPAHTLR